VGCGWWVRTRPPGHLRLPPAHLAEAFDEFTCVLRGQLPGLVAELGETGLRIAGRGEVVAVVFGAAGEQFVADTIELALNLDVPGEVQ